MIFFFYIYTVKTNYVQFVQEPVYGQAGSVLTSTSSFHQMSVKIVTLTHNNLVIIRATVLQAFHIKQSDIQKRVNAYYRSCGKVHFKSISYFENLHFHG